MIERHVQLFGRDLGQRSAQSRPEVYFAAINSDLSVGIDRQKAVDLVGCNSLLSGAACAKAEQAFSASVKLTTVLAGFQHVERVETKSSIANPLSQALRAARCTARMMRRCVPQRQRLSASAFLICGTVGFWVFARSAVASMIMPLRQ